jgi:hypothetical protein
LRRATANASRRSDRFGRQRTASAVFAVRQFRTIVADPPWASSSPAGRAAPERHYPTMPLEAIRELAVGPLAEERAHLYLWALNSNLAAAWSIAETWGFRPLTILTWCKRGPGVGYWFRTNTEHVLFCTRGKAYPKPAAGSAVDVVPVAARSPQQEARGVLRCRRARVAGAVPRAVRSPAAAGLVSVGERGRRATSTYLAHRRRRGHKRVI